MATILPISTYDPNFSSINYTSKILISEMVGQILATASSCDPLDQNPATSIKAYVLRLDKYYTEEQLIKGHLSNKSWFKDQIVNTNYKIVLITSLIFLHMYQLKNNTIFNAENIHRLFASAFLVAHKYICDFTWTNAQLKNLIGIPLEELNRLEIDFLFKMDFDLTISPKIFLMFSNQILKNIFQSIIPNPLHQL